MKCQICNKEVKDFRALSTHIQFKHENKSKEYYDSWLLPVIVP
jgi:predicted transcriptional regulator